jgi:RNA polymerase-binding transcription factor DksA
MDIEKYSDPLDVASRNEAIATEDALREQRKKAVPQQTPDEHGFYAITECLECGEDIGLERLRVATKNCYCLSCVEDQEKRDARSKR